MPPDAVIALAVHGGQSIESRRSIRRVRGASSFVRRVKHKDEEVDVPSHSVAIGDDTPPAPEADEGKCHESTTYTSEPDIIVAEPVDIRTLANPPKMAASVLPRCLELGGNAKSWKLVLDHLKSPFRGAPLILAGPVGCGKMYGIDLIMRRLDVTFDVVDAGTKMHDAIDALNGIMGAKTFGGSRGIVFAGFNGFQSDIIAKVIAYVDERFEKRKSTAPLVFTCVDAWAMSIKATRHWKRATLYKPRDVEVERIMRLAFPRASQALIKNAVAHAEGDLRKCAGAIETSAPNGTKDVERNIYDDTRRLVSATAHPTEWTLGAANRDSATFGAHPLLLHHNYTTMLAPTDIAGAARVSDALSLAAMAPKVHMHQLALAAVGMPNHSAKMNFPTHVRSATERQPYDVPSILFSQLGVH